MSRWFHNNLSNLKFIVPIIILILATIFVYGQWTRYEAQVLVLAQELQIRNMNIDAARRDMVEVINTNDAKIKEIRKNFLKVIADNKDRDKVIAMHQLVDDKKFISLLNLYIEACNAHTTPTLPTFDYGSGIKGKDKSTSTLDHGHDSKDDQN